MKILETSWHRRLYNLTYPREVPTNLCPYFWATFAAFICFLFNVLWTLPVLTLHKIVNFFTKEDDSILDEDEMQYFHRHYFLSAFLFNFIIYALFSMVFVWWGNEVWIIGAITGYVVTAFLIIYFIGRGLKLLFKRRTPYEYKEPKPNIFIEMVKAKYKRYCPQIEWTKK